VAEGPGLVDSYARWRQTPLGEITERVETKVVFDLAGPLLGRRVLDVGTGDGTYAIEAARRGAQVTGIDVDPAMLAAARLRSDCAGVSVALREARAEELPFDDGAFDVVLAVTVLCLVPDARGAVREMARVLAPGGRLVLGELGRFSVWAAERRVRGWLGSSTWKRARFWSRTSLSELARDAGLHVVETRGSIFYPPSDVAARLGAVLEPLLTRLRAPGAAFLALAADKPESRP
jgi:SAM-dependent methyltransferase